MKRVYSLMNREVPISALESLEAALRRSQGARSGLDDIDASTGFALGFDTNALFRVGQNGDLGVNAVDYLAEMHAGPVIIPGQVIQEVWKNALAAVLPGAKKLKVAIDGLTRELEKLDRDLGPASSQAIDAAQAFAASHGDWIDPPSQEIFLRTITSLISRAICMYVPRERFAPLARIRNDTKTPPGYEDPDSNHGDFFVWADFLYGLSATDLQNVSRVVLVTDDKKPDWSRGGVAHPLLVAEAEALTGLPFEMCTLTEFQRLARRLIGSD